METGNRHTGERIQSDDCKGDPRTWEKNGRAQSKKLQAVFNRELKNIKNNQTELKNS